MRGGSIDVRNQCVRANVAFFFKQWGGRTPKAGGRLLEGKEWSQFPMTLPRVAGQPDSRAMAVTELIFSEIGYWSELKLEIIAKYGSAYTNAFRNQKLKKYYIDAFCGSGVHVSKETGDEVAGSPARALQVSPPFDGYYFIDLEQEKTDYLQGLCGNRRDVHIYTADATSPSAERGASGNHVREVHARAVSPRSLRAAPRLECHRNGRQVAGNRRVP